MRLWWNDKVKLNRRQFLKGLIAAAAAGTIAPLSLVESVHGASDLTARERDIAAKVMGLRQEQWCEFDGVWKGHLAHVAIWEQPLSDAEIAMLNYISDPAHQIGIQYGKLSDQEEGQSVLYYQPYSKIVLPSNSPYLRLLESHSDCPFSIEIQYSRCLDGPGWHKAKLGSGAVVEVGVGGLFQGQFDENAQA